MHKLKKITRDYLTFSKKERNVGSYLSIIIIMILVFPSFQKRFLISQTALNCDSLSTLLASMQVDDVIDSAKIYSADKSYENKYTGYNNYNDDHFNKNRYYDDVEYDLFQFDPNTISKEEWMKLGIKDFIADRIVNYRNKGGKFKTKDDLLKTYGFRNDDFERLKEYIVIDSAQLALKGTTPQSSSKPIIRMNTEINSATAEQIMQLGFTEDVTARILKLRDELGGINSSEQLNTVYNIDRAILDEAIPYMQFDKSLIKMININTCSVETLALHKYISDELAKAIVEYRVKTGKFYSLSEVMKVKGMYPALFEKLKPYLYL